MISSIIIGVNLLSEDTSLTDISLGNAVFVGPSVFSSIVVSRWIESKSDFFTVILYEFLVWVFSFNFEGIEFLKILSHGTEMLKILRIVQICSAESVILLCRYRTPLATLLFLYFDACFSIRTNEFISNK